MELKIGRETVKVVNAKDPRGNLYTSERYIEVPLIRWFADRYGKKMIEIGCVSPHHMGGLTHQIFDKAEKHPRSTMQDMMTLNLDGKNVLCISTVEHVEIKDSKENGAILALRKIMKEAGDYLVTFPYGYNSDLDEWAIENCKANTILLSWKTGTVEDWKVEGNSAKNKNSKDRRFLFIITNIKDLLESD